MKNVLVLGCTGSIGSQTLDVIRNRSGEFSVAGLCAGSNGDALDRLCAEFGCPGTLFSRDGTDGIRRLIEQSGADMAVNGISGSNGLVPSLLVLQAGIDLALANKETVVMAWDIARSIAAKTGAQIVPVDSEHSAVFCLLHGMGAGNVGEIVITASGGPFRTMEREQLEHVTVEQALAHPTWKMGRKITVDSATLANKGLEVIEACRLFDVRPEQVTVLVHPQSLVHSMVRTRDGMLYAQISDPDMRHPIQNALTWPDVRGTYLTPFDLAGKELTFYKPRTDDFRMLPLAYEAATRGGSCTIAYNAANEVAVDAFLRRELSFTQIALVTEQVLGAAGWGDVPRSTDDVMAADRAARDHAEQAVRAMHRSVG